jgi:hypothetical protein
VSESKAGRTSPAKALSASLCTIIHADEILYARIKELTQSDGVYAPRLGSTVSEKCFCERNSQNCDRNATT